jgi:hypothetical protein
VKGLLVASIVALVIVGGLGIYALKVLGDVQQRGQALDEDFEARAKALRETDVLFPCAPVSRLDAVRFPTWLEVRGEVARAFAARAAEPASNSFHARETMNGMLVLLRGELVEKQMGLSEYGATAARWRALLALPEFAELQQAWRKRTATDARPEGLPLPAAAADAEEKELEQIRRYARLLEGSMDADLLDPLLAKVGGGTGEGAPKASSEGNG